MINTLPRLSVWELACRINNFDPDKIKPPSIPNSVKDASRSLTRAFHYDDCISVLSSQGIENHTIRNSKTGTSYNPELVHKKISECYEDAIYDIDFLDSIYIENHDFVKLCHANKIPLPGFWFPYGWEEEDASKEEKSNSAEKLRPSQLDKLLCQAIGRTLWDIYPNMTIAEMCKHEAIQKYGNGRLYQGAHTLRGWLSNVAPDNVRNKRGRPTKE